MRQADVFYNEEKAGVLSESSGKKYRFCYSDSYFANPEKPAISLTLPKNQQEYNSDTLFPFFYNLIAEGANLSLQSKYLKIDKQDFFGILYATTQHDTIGPVTLKVTKDE
jgi:serine/threonine-protein kinase HipA